MQLPLLHHTFLTLNNSFSSLQHNASKPEHASIPLVLSATKNLPDQVCAGRPNAWIPDYMLKAMCTKLHVLYSRNFYGPHFICRKPLFNT